MKKNTIIINFSAEKKTNYWDLNEISRRIKKNLFLGQITSELHYTKVVIYDTFIKFSAADSDLNSKQVSELES